MSEILDRAKQFRKELISGNDKALNQLKDAYVASTKRIQSDLDKLTAMIEKERAHLGSLENVQKLHPSWLMRQDRYKALIAQCELETAKLSKLSVEAIKEAQSKAIELGNQHALRLMQANLWPVPPEVAKAGLSFTWVSVPQSALQHMVGFLSDGSPLEYKFVGMSSEIAEGVKQQLMTGIVAGLSPREISKNVTKLFDGALYNSLATCRTESLRSYRAASDANYDANKDVLESWIWSAGHSDRTCAACWGQDGSEHSLDEKLCDHVCGRCSKIPRTKTWQELFPDLDMSDVEETRANPWDPTEAFKKLSPEKQLKVLGPGKFSLWTDGKIHLRDIPTIVPNEVWGSSVRVGTLDDILKRAAERNGTEEPENLTRSYVSAKKTSLDDWDYRALASLPRVDGVNDQILAAMWREQGFDGLPELGPVSEFDRAEQAGQRLFYRGFVGRKSISADGIFEQFLHGDTYTGYGMFGNGIYAGYGDAFSEVAKEYAGHRFGERAGLILRMGLRSDAKVAHEALWDEHVAQIKAWKSELESLKKQMGDATGSTLAHLEDQCDELKARVKVLEDFGRYATAKGYDAIEFVADDSPEYLIIQNRTALKVQETPYEY